MLDALTEEQAALRAGIAAWADDLSRDHRAREDAAGFSFETWRRVGESGVLGLPFAPEHGGLGQDVLGTMHVLEELGHRCRDAGLLFVVATQICSTGIPVQRFGSACQKSAWLPELIAGRCIGAHAITEPDAGSSAFEMRTRAVREGNRWRLDGSKCFISNAPIADLITVYARTDPDKGVLGGFSAFLVETGRPGVSVGPPQAKMGLKTAPLADVHLDGILLDEDAVIGRPGMGFAILDHVMKWEILLSFVINVGEMRHRLERCLAYARERRQGGQPIGKHQAVAHKLVDMHLRIETARLWLYRAGAKLAANQPVTTELAAAKLLASEANVQTALDAITLHGGNGYMSEFGLEAELRNAVGGMIYSGTSEIQRNRIAAMLGL
jgi:alkylation response protein AidB-like acyl-CoA dehydrogenase